MREEKSETSRLQNSQEDLRIFWKNVSAKLCKLFVRHKVSSPKIKIDRCLLNLFLNL